MKTFILAEAWTLSRLVDSCRRAGYDVRGQLELALAPDQEIFFGMNTRIPVEGLLCRVGGRWRHGCGCSCNAKDHMETALIFPPARRRRRDAVNHQPSSRRRRIDADYAVCGRSRR